MEENLIKSLNELKDALTNDPRVIALNEAEQSLYADPALIELIKKKNAAEEDYQLALRIYGEKDEKTKEKEKALYIAKLQMDENETAKNYSELYIVVRDLYMQIDDVIFSPFRKKTIGDVR